MAIDPDLFPAHELPPAKADRALTKATAAGGRRRERAPAPSDPFFDPTDKAKNNFARSWLAFNFALDGLLGIGPGDMTRPHNTAFKEGPTRRFLDRLQMETVSGTG